MKRIQRKRTKGWRMPENTVYVGRPSKWGNPCKAKGLQGASTFATYLSNPRIAYQILVPEEAEKVVEHMEWIRDNIEQLRGKDLACWCKEGEPCHGDVLIEYLNEKL